MAILYTAPFCNAKMATYTAVGSTYKKCYTLKEYYNRPLFKWHFFSCVIVSKCISSEIICLLMDVRLAVFLNLFIVMQSFEEKTIKNHLFGENVYLKRNFHHILVRLVTKWSTLLINTKKSRFP